MKKFIPQLIKVKRQSSLTPVTTTPPLEPPNKKFLTFREFVEQSEKSKV